MAMVAIVAMFMDGGVMGSNYCGSLTSIVPNISACTTKAQSLISARFNSIALGDSVVAYVTASYVDSNQVPKSLSAQFFPSVDEMSSLTISNGMEYSVLSLHPFFTPIYICTDSRDLCNLQLRIFCNSMILCKWSFKLLQRISTIKFSISVSRLHNSGTSTTITFFSDRLW